MTTQGKVFIVDDDPGMRESLGLLLETEGYTVETYAGATDFLADCTENCCGCIILDVEMPGMKGPDLYKELLRRNIQIPVIILTGYATIPLAAKTIKLGAMDFLTKPVSGGLLIARVEEALRISQDILVHEEEVQLCSAALEALTPREHEIMKLIVAGHSTKEVARMLDISYRTVEVHRMHIMFKTGAGNLIELASMARHAGLQ